MLTAMNRRALIILAAIPAITAYAAGIHKRWLIQTFGQPGLDSAVRAAIGAPRRRT
jgi:hypothetical protein